MTATSALLILVALFIILNSGNIAAVMLSKGNPSGSTTIGQTPTTPAPTTPAAK